MTFKKLNLTNYWSKTLNMPATLCACLPVGPSTHRALGTSAKQNRFTVLKKNIITNTTGLTHD